MCHSTEDEFITSIGWEWLRIINYTKHEEVMVEVGEAEKGLVNFLEWAREMLSCFGLGSRVVQICCMESLFTVVLGILLYICYCLDTYNTSAAVFLYGIANCTVYDS